MRRLGSVCAAALMLAATGAVAQQPAQGLRSDQVEFRGLYKELVETNTTLSVGSCTEAAAKMKARLVAAGYPESDLVAFVPPNGPRWGGLTAVLHGTDPKARPMLLLAHIDVVEAKRADWARDPFVVTEESGVLYARGASDDKAEASVWVDTMVRLKREGFKPRRAVKMALTCGEETPETFDGAEWLVNNRRELVDAAFALNEGAGGRMDAAGKHIALNVQDGEKVYQDFKLESVSPGGHSSTPIKDNAIYHLAAALVKLRDFDFPVRVSDGNKAYFEGMASLTGGEAGAAMKAWAANPNAAAAAEILSRDRSWHSMLRTTCVATMANAGHAPNALPQHAEVNVNCRVFPGQTMADVQDTLAKVIDDPAVKVSLVPPASPTPPPPPLTPEILGPIKQAGADIWPGVPVVPVMATGATDGRFLTAAGIPTYGLTGFFADPAGSNAHGLNEHISVRSLMEGRDFLFDVVKRYAMEK